MASLFSSNGEMHPEGSKQGSESDTFDFGEDVAALTGYALADLEAEQQGLSNTGMAGADNSGLPDARAWITNPGDYRQFGADAWDM